MKYNIPVENFASFEKKMMRIINKAERYNVKVKYEKGEALNGGEQYGAESDTD